MHLNHENFTELQNAILDRIHLELIRSNANDELEKVLEKYNLNSFYEASIPCCDFYRSNTKRAKILVIAIEIPNIDEWRLRAKKLGVPNDRIEFMAIKSNFDYSFLRNSIAYSDVIVGPVPHKGVGIGDNTSFLTAAEHHPEEFPKVHKMQDGNGHLILSQSAFIKCLNDTNYVRECI